MDQDQPPAHPVRLRVASYNVRKCIGLDRRRLPERVIAVISEVGADVVAVQEADRRLGARPAALPADLIGELSDFAAVPLAANDVSLGWHGNAVLVRKLTTVRATGHLELPTLEPRGAVWVEFEHKGRDVRVVAVHLGLTRRHRRRQLATIARALHTRDAMPTVILGDFNEWSETKGLEPLERDFEVHVPGPSYHAARPVAPLDRIAVTRDITLVDIGVHGEGAALRASDHLPVWADLAIA